MFPDTDIDDAKEKLQTSPGVSEVEATFDQYSDDVALPGLDVKTSMSKEGLIEMLEGFQSWDGSVTDVNETPDDPPQEPEPVAPPQEDAPPTEEPANTLTISDFVEEFLASLDGPDYVVDVLRQTFDPIAGAVLDLVEMFGIDNVREFLNNRRLSFTALNDVQQALTQLSERSPRHQELVDFILMSIITSAPTTKD